MFDIKFPGIAIGVEVEGLGRVEFASLSTIGY